MNCNIPILNGKTRAIKGIAAAKTIYFVEKIDMSVSKQNTSAGNESIHDSEHSDAASEESEQSEWDDGRRPGAFVRAPSAPTLGLMSELDSSQTTHTVLRPGAHSTLNESIQSADWDVSKAANRRHPISTTLPDFNKSTRAAEALQKQNTLNDGAMTGMAYLIKQWPHEVFVEAEKHGEKRASWVEWAGNFANAIAIMGVTEDRLKASLLIIKGGKSIWQILGTNANNMSFPEMCEKIDRHYASMSDPQIDAAAYRKMSQKTAETLLEFVDRLKKQAKLAEFSEEEEYRELRLALLDRTQEAPTFRLQSKLQPQMTNSDLISLGGYLTMNEPKQENVRVMEITTADNKRPYEDNKEKRGESSFQPKRAKGEQIDRKNCKSCGKTHAGACRAQAKDKLCFGCGQPGHFAYNCPTKQNQEAAGKKQPQNKQGKIHQVKNTDDDWD